MNPHPDPGFAHLKQYLIAATGLAYYMDKDQDLRTRIDRRLARLEIGDYGSYLRLLEDPAEGAAELDALAAELTIGETYFFRQAEQLAAMARLALPALLGRNRENRRLRIWSAGCATGAEPYSVSILLRRECAHALAGWDIHILGTDINREFLARARDARFDEWALRATPAEIRRDCFRPEGKLWALLPEYRAGISFQYHNLARDPFPSLVDNLCGFDLILCRNVVIYFSREVTAHILGQLRECLVEGGWLLAGHSEHSPDLFREFRTVISGGETLYQKGEAAPEPARQAMEWQPAIWVEAPAAAPEIEPLPPPAPPQTPEAGVAAVRLLADRGEWEQAAACCRRLIEGDGLNPAAHFYYALVLDQMGDAEAAGHALRRAVYLDRSFVLAHYHLGLLLQRRDGRLARRSFANVLELLTRLEADHVFAHGDGITARQLGELTKMHLEVLGSRC